MIDLPPSVSALVDELADTAGVVAVALGGSRASGSTDQLSDWDLGVFYRGTLDLGPLSRRGEVHPPGSWGRLMNGGAWLTMGGESVDVILRDLDVVEHWAERAHRGEYEVDSLLGYVAGFPTYTLVAEVASSIVIRGRLEIDTDFSDALAEVATSRWSFQRDFSLDYACAHAARGSRIGTLGNLTRAVIEEAHRRMCARRAWVLNEKRLVAAAGLTTVESEFVSTLDLDDLIARVEAAVRQ